MVQWLRLRASTAGGTGSIPGQGTTIQRAPRHDPKKEKRNKDEPTHALGTESRFMSLGILGPRSPRDPASCLAESPRTCLSSQHFAPKALPTANTTNIPRVTHAPQLHSHGSLHADALPAGTSTCPANTAELQDAVQTPSPPHPSPQGKLSPPCPPCKVSLSPPRLPWFVVLLCRA